ncbi:YidC/Oxa1 family membrane protein insertase [Mailhella sp.]|uniref:YidC/Oxa1 family membrane protein insertase n=1 Tax=Mailhella sp. TaxID=1981029 RepID=UPI004062900D
MSWFYAVTIYPLELIYKSIYMLCADLSGSYGLALIALSLCTSFAIAPLKRLVSAAMRKEHELQLVLQPQLKKIREESRGAERHARITRLYRRYAYHPVMGIRSILGVALQIPFLMAAYYMVEGLDVLKGQSFWFLADLSQPDGLLGGINLLPIAMTLINLAAVFSSPQMHGKDRVQASAVALLFFVLLYSAPSALLFYWTLNNILSLAEGLMQKGWTKCACWTAFVQRIAELSKKFEVLERPQILIVLAIIGFALDRVLYLIIQKGRFLEYLDFLMPLLQTGMSLIFILFLLLFLSWVLQKKFSTLLWTVFALSSAAVCALGMHYQHALWMLIAFLFITIFYRTGRFSTTAERLATHFPDRDLHALASKSLLLVALIILAYTPSRLMLADASFVSSHTFAILIVGSLLIFTVPYLIFHSTRKELQIILALLFCLLALVAVVYTFFLVRDYGVIDAYIFEHAERITLKWYRYVDMAAGLVILSAALVLFIKKLSILNKLITVALTVTILLCGYSYGRLLLADSPKPVAESSAPQKHLRLSRTAPNILVIMLDSFTGDHIGTMMKEYPHLLTSYEGFTWHPDTLSAGECTHMSLPSMIAGTDIASYYLNHDDGVSLEEKIGNKTDTFISELRSKNFSTTFAVSNTIPYIREKKYVSHSIFKEYAAKYQGESQGRAEYIPGIFAASYGLFEAMPWSIRKNIYRKGRWFFSGNSTFDRCVEHYSVLVHLSDMTAIDSGGSSYTLFTNELTHLPWSISKDTLKPVTYDPFPDTIETLEMRDGLVPEHYYAEMATIKLVGDFLDFLKQENAYDNTFIVLISDHCSGDSQPLSATFGNAAPARAKQTYPGRPNALMLVKDFHQRGALRVDDAPLATSDLRAMTEAAVEGRPFVFPPANRPRYHATGDWHRGRHGKNAYTLQSLWEINGPKLKRESWKKIPTNSLSRP